MKIELITPPIISLVGKPVITVTDGQMLLIQAGLMESLEYHPLCLDTTYLLHIMKTRKGIKKADAEVPTEIKRKLAARQIIPAKAGCLVGTISFNKRTPNTIAHTYTHQIDTINLYPIARQIHYQNGRGRILPYNPAQVVKERHPHTDYKGACYAAMMGCTVTPIAGESANTHYTVSTVIKGPHETSRKGWWCIVESNGEPITKKQEETGKDLFNLKVKGGIIVQTFP